MTVRTKPPTVPPVATSVAIPPKRIRKNGSKVDGADPLPVKQPVHRKSRRQSPKAKQHAILKQSAPRRTPLKRRQYYLRKRAKNRRLGTTFMGEPIERASKSKKTEKGQTKKGPPKGAKYIDSANHQALNSISRPPVQPVTHAIHRSAKNLLDEIGGEDKLLTVLDESDHPFAPKLADLVRSDLPDVQKRSFGRKILDAGLTPTALAEILYDRQKTRAFVQVTMDLPEVVAGIIRRAKDRFDRCTSCLGYGRQLTEDQLRDQQPPDDSAQFCRPCDGVGWLLVSGESEAIELFLELARLRKSGQQTVYDFSRKQLQQNQFNNPTMNFGGSSGDGQPPSIDSIIKRADQQRYLPLPTPVSTPVPLMPTPILSVVSTDASDSVIDAELMPEEISTKER